MPSEFCGYCDKNIDIKAYPEHFPDSYWEGDSKCQVEIDEDRWNIQAHWGDHINKKVKENPNHHKLRHQTRNFNQ